MAYIGRPTISSYRDEYGYALDPLGGGCGRQSRRQTWSALLLALVVAAVAIVAVFAWRYSSTHPAAPVGLMRIETSVAQSAAALPATVQPAPAQPQLAMPAALPQQPEAAPAGHDPDVVMFGNRRIRPVRTMRMVVTAYSPDARSCGKWADGITASGKSVWTNGMRLVAADTRLLPFGSIVSVPGYNGGRPVPVLDRGGAIKGKRLDVLYPTHEIARRWGRQPLEVTIWEYVD